MKINSEDFKQQQTCLSPPNIQDIERKGEGVWNSVTDITLADSTSSLELIFRVKTYTRFLSISDRIRYLEAASQVNLNLSSVSSPSLDCILIVWRQLQVLQDQICQKEKCITKDILNINKSNRKITFIV